MPAFETWAKNNMLTLQLIIANGSAIGCVAYGKARDTTLSNWGEIVSIYLLPDYFGKGYGSKLLRETLSDLNQNGYQDIYLWVLKENQPARRFYKKNNFRCTDDECICEIMGTKLTELRYTYSFDPTS